MIVVFCRQKTAYWVGISDGGSDGCSSDLRAGVARTALPACRSGGSTGGSRGRATRAGSEGARGSGSCGAAWCASAACPRCPAATARRRCPAASTSARSEEHTSELQSLMRISYAVFCLKKKKQQNGNQLTLISSSSPKQTRRTQIEPADPQHQLVQ